MSKTPEFQHLASKKLSCKPCGKTSTTVNWSKPLMFWPTIEKSACKFRNLPLKTNEGIWVNCKLSSLHNTATVNLALVQYVIPANQLSLQELNQYSELSCWLWVFLKNLVLSPKFQWRETTGQMSHPLTPTYGTVVFGKPRITLWHKNVFAN